MTSPLSSSVELLLGLIFAYLLVVGLLTYGLPRILMGSLPDEQRPDQGQGGADHAASRRVH